MPKKRRLKPKCKSDLQNGKEIIITKAQRMSSDYSEYLRSCEHLSIVSGVYPKEKFNKVFKYAPENQWAVEECIRSAHKSQDEIFKG